MSKVHPQKAIATAATSSSKQESFTIWMKSLILHGFGCTVFDSHGQIAYRVDNYNHKCSKQVFLMGSHGKLLFSIFKKKFKLFGGWEVYSTDVVNSDDKHGFQVWKRGDSFFMGLDKNQPHHYYKVESCGSKSSCKIVDNSGVLVAEVKRKRSTSGVDLGEDVLTMMVEPYIDHSFIMAFIVVYGLYNRKM